MPLHLPAPDTDHLKHSPLDLVVCQIRFENQVNVSDARTARDFFDRLNSGEVVYKQINEDKASNGEIIIGPQGPITTNQSQLRGWRFPAVDDGWSAIIFPSHAALETVDYKGWEEAFKPRLHTLIEAVSEIVQPALEQRLGLRYIDRISKPSLPTAGEWARFITPEFAGPLAHEELGPSIAGAHQQLLIELDDGVSCQMRHGPVLNEESKTHDYLIDCDISRSGGRAFDVDSIKGQLEDLHTSALQLFQSVIRPELHKTLKGDE